jgi:DNA-3-methyladenine glycosylase II
VPTFAQKLKIAEKHLTRADRRLARIIRDTGPCTLRLARGSPFESLTRAVAYQQITGRAGDTILARFVALYPGKRFPEPEDVLVTPLRSLRSVGFSRNKVKAIRDIAAKTHQGLVPTRAQARRLDDDELIERLVEIYGVGRWTVEMLLIFTLGRMNVLPIDDYGVQCGLRHAYTLRRQPTLKDFERLTASWHPYRSIGSWYLWRYMDARKTR